MRQLRSRLRLGGATAADTDPTEALLTGRAVGENRAAANGAEAGDADPAAGGLGRLDTLAAAEPPRSGDRLPALTLEGCDLSVVFGGVVAADHVSLRVGPGERVAIVGANGAGKTTVFNALTGFVPLHGGRVMLGSEDITCWAPLARARAGLRRTFQQPRLADVLTVGQNVICGHGSNTAVRRQRVEWLLGHFGLSGLRDVPVAALPFGVRRQVELIRALAERPQVLMLDEPVSGLEDEEAETLVELLLDLQAKEGWGLLVIEHALAFITSIAQHLIVMEDGCVLVQGAIGEVMREEQVRRVYLGETVTV
jgi:branched-chain amino acid transport system permease protein